MENKQFSELLHEAITGNLDAVEAILSRYMPLISNKSMLNQRRDEDLQQYILMRVIIMIPKFDPDFAVRGGLTSESATTIPRNPCYCSLFHFQFDPKTSFAPKADPNGDDTG